MFRLAQLNIDFAEEFNTTKPARLLDNEWVISTTYRAHTHD